VIVLRERLWPRWWVWAIVLGLTGLLGWAYGVALGAVAGTAVFVASVVLVAVLIRVTAPNVELTQDSLRVGDATLPPRMISAVRVVARQEIQAMRGPGADARVFVELRPWSATRAVLVDVGDPTDPHPAWLFSSRHPEAMARAITDTIGQQAHQDPLAISRQDPVTGSRTMEDS